ncbi:MAG: hypothetical protein GVY29_06450 [Spirochaetes bacterium]|nr:hypothetical protein [Spirochaetota bacterium]
MGRIITAAVVVGIVGLGVGYLIFGRIGGEFVAIDQLFRLPGDGIEGALQKIGEDITGIRQARQNILISGAVGLAVGAVIGATGIGGRRRRR